MTAARPLDALNFALADVRDGLGPYLAIWLVSTGGWDQAATGLVLGIAGLAGLLAQPLAGALVDAVPQRRALLGMAVLVVALACLALPMADGGFAWVAGTQALAGAASAVFAPAIAALTLGIVGQAAFAARTGRNEAFNHAGNAAAALAAGGLSLWVGPGAVFGLLAGMGALSLVALAAIPPGAIDPRRARGLEEGGGAASAGSWRALAGNRALLAFALCLGLFHLSNAAMLPLVGQQLAAADASRGTALMSACIVAAQLVMVPMAWLAGARAGRWGHKKLLLAAFGVLALRGALYPVSDAAWWLLAVQALDGVGAGLTGALVPMAVASLTRGSGHFGAALGALATAQGLGAALSNTLAGLVVARAGYAAGYGMLAGMAVLGGVLLWRLVPETREGRD